MFYILILTIYLNIEGVYYCVYMRVSIEVYICAFGEDFFLQKYHKFRKQIDYIEICAMLADHRFRGDHKYIGRMIPLRFIPQLDLVLDGRVIALDGHIRNAQLEIVLRPILQFGHSIGSLVVHRKVGEQHAGRVRSDEDEHMPEGMHVRKVNAPPGVAEELVRYPAAEGQHEDEAAADAQAVDARTAFTVYTNEFRKIVGKIQKLLSYIRSSAYSNEIVGITNSISTKAFMAGFQHPSAVAINVPIPIIALNVFLYKVYIYLIIIIILTKKKRIKSSFTYRLPCSTRGKYFFG